MSSPHNDKSQIIRIPDPVGVKDLSGALGEKVFKIMADILELGQFQNIHGTLDFETASRIARKHGYSAEKIG